MGRLAGFKADDVVRKLRRAGFVFDRQRKGSHQIWWLTPDGAPRFRAIPATCRREPLPPSSSRQGLTADEFLAL